MNSIEILVDEWSNQSGDNRFRFINQYISFIADKLYYDYEPMLGPNFDFFNRFENWILNCTEDEDKKTLFELVTKIFYIGQKEFFTLYRNAYNTLVGRWLINIGGLNFSDTYIQNQLMTMLLETWFCPITDSMRINQFYHINNINNGFDLRPHWKSCEELGDISKIKSYISNNCIRNIVLLEDFVGSGSQIESTLRWACTNFKNTNFLFIPLIICPDGDLRLKKMANENANLNYKPALILSNDSFVFPPSKSLLNDESYNKFRELAIKTNEAVMSPYGAFGYKDTGGLIVMYTNTPDNTLPLIHNESINWKPLFKRHSRV